ncbi:hypothetical protein Tco_1173540 [Tanacetum coccineum]
MATFKVLEILFQMFIKSRIYLDDEYVIMTCKYFLKYTQLEVQEFHDTLIQHMEYVKKPIDKRALHKREYDNRVNERQMQTTEENVDLNKALDASLVIIECSRTNMEKQDTSSRSGNDADADNKDIKPVYDEETMNAEQCHDVRHLLAKLTDNHITELSNQSLESENIYVIETINIELEHKVAKLLKENETLKKHYKELYDSINTTRAKTIEQTTSLIAQNAEFKVQLQEKGFAIAALKNELRNLKGNSTTHYLPMERESAFAKPHHMIAPSSFRYSSNDMVHNHYLEEAKKKTQERGRNSRPSVIPSAKSESTDNGSKPKPMINNQKSKNWHASKTSCVTTNIVPIVEHFKNFRNFSASKTSCVTTKTGSFLAMITCERLRVHKENIQKTTFRTRYGHFEFTVMPFGLTNLPASKENHKVYLKLELELQKEEKLFVKFSNSKAWSACVDHLRSWWKIYFTVLVDIAEGIGNTAKHAYNLSSSNGRIKVEVGDEVMLEVSFWKDVVHFGKKDMLAPRYKCLADANLHVPLDEIKIDKTLRFIEEPLEIMDCEVRSLKRSKISLVKGIQSVVPSSLESAKTI